MSFDGIPEDKKESYQCPECDNGSVTQCDVSGDWCCDSCEWWVDAEDASEDDDE